MKTIIHFFLLILCISFTACPDTITPTEMVNIRINNSTPDILNLYYNQHYYADDDDWIDTIILHSLPFSINRLGGILDYDASIRNNVFDVVIKNKITRKRLIVIEEMSGDTLAKWNDTSAVFTDQQYWTITATGSKYMTFDCTLNLTDEVLKLK